MPRSILARHFYFFYFAALSLATHFVWTSDAFLSSATNPGVQTRGRCKAQYGIVDSFLKK
jgi:hypothetical protein